MHNEDYPTQSRGPSVRHRINKHEALHLHRAVRPPAAGNGKFYDERAEAECDVDGHLSSEA